MRGEAASGRASRRSHTAIAAALTAALAVPALAWGGPSTPLVDPTVPAKRDTEPVVLTGASFGEWSSNSNASVKLPLTDLIGCPSVDKQVPGNPPRDNCSHNNYVKPEVDTGGQTLRPGVPVDRLLGYRWDDQARSWRQIPFQVDEVFTRYLDNSASGFALYSGQDQHTSYAFDREGFRFTQSDPNNPCLARAPGGVGTTADPVKGLDANDELAFMASDAGPAAPSGTPLPPGIEGSRAVAIADPLKPTGAPTIVYVMLAAANGPRAQFDASNGYVHYARDPNADFFERSVSSYSNYGNAARGTICDAQGKPIGEDKRRPRDYATVTTNRYSFRYDGRWLMTSIRVSPDAGHTFGPDLVDRWKARAFQQDPSSNTPCCGFEEEDSNWGGSSTLMGERVGPVRAIRETWGADSGTNVVRRETFYRDEVRQKTWLRVHVIPPLDGIYAQWDFNAGVMQTYRNPYTNTRDPSGVKIDGHNDEVFGNFDDPCNSNYNANDTTQLDQGYRTLYRTIGLCDPRLKDPRDGGPGPTYHQSIDVSDPTFGGANAALSWSQTSGPYGTIVDRYQVDRVTDLTPGGAAQSVVAVPYYRDDSCFDDGTGTDPGPKVNLRSGDEPRTFNGAPRTCWHPPDGAPDGSARFFQGSIGTHGLHLLFLAESDNARQTVPVDEIVSEQRMVMLPGDPGNVGEQYGRGFEKPVVAAVGPAEAGKVMLGPPASGDPGGGGNPGGGNPGGGNSGGGNPGSGNPGGDGSGGAGTPTSASRSTGAATTQPSAGARAMTARRTRVRRGAFQIRCLVTGPARGCAVTVSAAGRTIGRGAALARPGAPAIVTVRLTPAGRRLLDHARRGLPARVTARATGAGSGRSGTSTTLLLS